ncbi:MAG: L-aspartate oxidase [Bacteroidales bacterium]|jgi:L-aspartate oxidase|nr:L-aspartate oxidase [Bacteroidales bacterium]
MKVYTDFLVIGTGIAGLSFALKVADHGKVLLISKASLTETATKYAQGGIAAVMYDPDTYEKHIHDTMNAGSCLNNEEIVRLVVANSTERIKELIEWGAQFDKTKTGEYALGREGGHSENRVLHHKDSTGNEIERALYEKVRQHKNIEILENSFSIDIITQHHLGEQVTRHRNDIACYGAYILRDDHKTITTVLSKITLLATGGVGNVYMTTTNPRVATGDGIAMVYRAKGTVKNMEFIQFHPTALYNPKESPSFLITEALRGFGAVLKDIRGKEFMQKYDKRQSLAPRDIVARAIDKEMKMSGDDYVMLDCRHLNHNDLIEEFPGIFAKCLSIGIDIRKDMIPVVPAAHYLCGGIETNSWAQTVIHNLYATGECAWTGLHGANRLASNSLLEAIVFSHRAAQNALEIVDNIAHCDKVPDWNAEGMVLNEEMVLITQSLKEVQQIMSSYVGIVRSNLRLNRALSRLEIIHKETEDLYDKSILSPQICELRNLINIAYLIIKQAMQRHESVGLHYSLDYPEQVGCEK